jgi:hypothetical protein
MEELHRLHKDVPFGWVLWVQEAMLAAHGFWHRNGAGPWQDFRAPAPPVADDLHCLSGPH